MKRRNQVILAAVLFVAMLALLYRVMMTWAEGEHGIGDVLLVLVALASGVLATELFFANRIKKK